MSESVSACNHAEWDRYELKEYGEIAEKTHDCNQKDLGDCTQGTWFYIPDEPHFVKEEDETRVYRVIYSGTWGNYSSPGADSYTYADLYDCEDKEDMKEFQKDQKRWNRKPEWL